MDWKKRRWIGYILVTVVFCIICLTFLWKPGIPVQDPSVLNEKLKSRIGRVIGPQSRVVYLHLDGLGASEKFRYAIVRYFAPGEVQSRHVSLYIDGSGKSFDLDSGPDSDGVTAGDGIPLNDLDFSVIATNVKRIRDLFMEEGKTWMGVSEYVIRYDPAAGEFVHETEIWHEEGSVPFKWLVQYLSSVTPGEKVPYTIRQNGTGPLEKK